MTAELYRRGGIRWAGLIAYVAGIAASVPFMSQQAFTGYIAARYLQGADISYYVGFLVAGALYLILARPRTVGVSPPERVVRGSQAGRVSRPAPPR